MNLRSVTGVLISLAVALVVAGCGGRGDRPELGEVTGKVMYNGKPLSNAQVAFRPVEGGRFASGTTYENGRYRLLYILFPQEVWGAKVGEQTVIITTFLSEHDPGGPQPERVPECYRGKDTVLRATVEPGENELNFSLADDCST